MGKKNSGTIENRVYLFRELAAAWLSNSGETLSAEDPKERARGLQVLADLAYASCAVSDTEKLDAQAVKERLQTGLGLTPEEH